MEHDGGDKASRASPAATPTVPHALLLRQALYSALGTGDDYTRLLQLVTDDTALGLLDPDPATGGAAREMFKSCAKVLGFDLGQVTSFLDVVSVYREHITAAPAASSEFRAVTMKMESGGFSSDGIVAESAMLKRESPKKKRRQCARAVARKTATDAGSPRKIPLAPAVVLQLAWVVMGAVPAAASAPKASMKNKVLRVLAAPTVSFPRDAQRQVMAFAAAHSRRVLVVLGSVMYDFRPHKDCATMPIVNVTEMLRDENLGVTVRDLVFDASMLRKLGHFKLAALVRGDASVLDAELPLIDEKYTTWEFRYRDETKKRIKDTAYYSDMSYGVACRSALRIMRWRKDTHTVARFTRMLGFYCEESFAQLRSALVSMEAGEGGGGPGFTDDDSVSSGSTMDQLPCSRGQVATKGAPDAFYTADLKDEDECNAWNPLASYPHGSLGDTGECEWPPFGLRGLFSWPGGAEWNDEPANIFEGM